MLQRKHSVPPAIRLAVSALVLCGLAALTDCSRLGSPTWFSAKHVDFSREIQPIFNQNCTSCHGGVRQKAGVSFIFREEALGTGKSGHRTIIPGDPDHSELIARITSKDTDVRMPYHAPPLQPEQVALIRRWINEGANWSDYWAFVPPKPQSPPSVKNVRWPRQTLDSFVLGKLENEGLSPSAEADKALLLRRVSLDLTGLPPTAEEQDAFLTDHSADAYEKQVDRLLSSTAYGEKWASMWLDLARYADSYGYEADNLRLGVWAYRDWVVDAFNRNLPYDQFVTKQLAGDLLPNATFEDRIATSFHRQTPNNQEGGTDDEEFRMVAVMDRNATTWSVLNGLTMNCVQCHSHPYDPIRHAEYYKSLGFFNYSNDADRDDDFPNLLIPKDKSKYAEAAQIQQELVPLVRGVVNSDRALVDQVAWKAAPIQQADANDVPALRDSLPPAERYLGELRKDKDSPAIKSEDIKNQLDSIHVLKTRLAAAEARGGPAKTFRLENGEAWANTDTPPKSIYELDAQVNLSAITAIRIEVPPIDADKARHTPEDGFVVDQTRVFAVHGDNKKELALSAFFHDSEEDLETAISAKAASEKKASSAKEDGKAKAASHTLADGFSSNPKLFRTRWIVAVLAEPLQFEPGSLLRVALTQTREIDYKPVQIKRVRISVSDDARLASRSVGAERTDAVAVMSGLEQRLQKIPGVNVPVMSEEPPYEKRVTLEFERGNFLNKIGPALEPDVPSIFPKLPTDAPRNRLTLAKWFFQPGQPLTSRVAVNRYWEQLFGIGLVETLENFGSVGETPTNPELLDWLALHFQNDLHWDMKALLRELVTSATYRQQSTVTPELLQRDPRNRLLARGPQQRLTAEMIRDQALLAAGLLDRTMGGTPVMPPQPPGVWNSVYNRDKWTDASGPNRYRRAIYTFVKRTSGYPSFLIFDGSDRATTLPRRIPTNTPLQALVTLNDPVYDEVAQALAARVLKDTHGGSLEAKNAIDQKLMYEARLVLSRDPTDQELTLLRGLYQKSLTGKSLIGKSTTSKSMTGSGPTLKRASMNLSADESSNANSADAVALKAVATVLLNTDAAMTR